MEKITEFVGGLTGGLSTAKQHIRDIAYDLKEIVRQSGMFSSNMSGMGGGGGGGGLNIGNGGPVFNNNPSFGGASGGQPVSTMSFGPAAQAGGALAFAGLKASLPGASTAITTDAVISYMKFYAGMGPDSTKSLVKSLNNRGLATSSTDAVSALLEAQKYGFTGQPNFSTTMATGFAEVSRTIPGAGLTGGVQVTGTMNQARSVNMMRSLGIQVRDPFTGQPKKPSEVADQIFRMISNSLGRAPTKQDINSSLMPGLGLYNFLNDLFPGDELTRNFVVKALLQRAQGGDFSEASLLDKGAVTSTQLALGKLQGTKGNIGIEAASPISGAVGAASTVAELYLQEISKGITSLVDYFQNITGKAGGGGMLKNKPYMVGEKGPELVVPKEDSTVVPNGSKGLRGILEQAGFSGKNLEIAAAVAYAESTGNTSAFNPNNRDLSYGLFQVNMKDDDPKSPWMGRNRRKQFGISNEDLFDPLTNARVAYAISNGGKDWGPWSTYNEGTYKKFLGKEVELRTNTSRYDKWLAGGGSPGVPTGTAQTASASTTSSLGGDGWVAQSGLSGLRASTVSYGGVNITINGANVSARDLIEEIKRQLKFENILSIMGAS